MKFIKDPAFLTFQPLFDLDEHTYLELSKDSGKLPFNLSETSYNIKSFVPFYKNSETITAVRIFHGDHGEDSEKSTRKNDFYI